MALITSPAEDIQTKSGQQVDELAKFVDLARLDVDRHAGIEAPAEPVPKPQLGSSFPVDPAVIKGTIELFLHVPSILRDARHGGFSIHCLFC